MVYNQEQMLKMLEIDRFLRETYLEINEIVNDEKAALKIVYDRYVTTEPIFQNAYNYLT